QDLALEQDCEQHVQHKEDEDGQRLAQHQPPGVVSEGGQGGHDPTPIFTVLPMVTPSLRCTAEPGEFSGSHTTRSGMSVMASGRAIDPRDVLTVTTSPSEAPISAAVSADNRTTGLRAVPARCGSPSCIRPSSSSNRHPVSTACPCPGVAG